MALQPQPHGCGVRFGRGNIKIYDGEAAGPTYPNDAWRQTRIISCRMSRRRTEAGFILEELRHQWSQFQPPMNNHPDSLTDAPTRIYDLLNKQDQSFRDRVNERSKRIEEGIAVTGECNAPFNEVLANTSFALAALPTLTTAPAIAKETAAILCQISLNKGLVEGHEKSGSQHLGWNNLNKDAKGWCKALLLAQVPSTTTPDDLRDLLIAKLFAAILVDHLLPITFRAVGEVGRWMILEDSVDE